MKSSAREVFENFCIALVFFFCPIRNDTCYILGVFLIKMKLLLFVYENEFLISSYKEDIISMVNV